MKYCYLVNLMLNVRFRKVKFNYIMWINKEINLDYNRW